MKSINKEALEQIFYSARTHNGWQNKPIEDHLLHELYDLMKWGPTAANSSPLRITFVKSHQEKEKLLKCMAAGNVEKTKLAPVTAILSYDLEFYEKLPTLFPHTDARSWYVGNDDLITTTAFRNSTLQAAYFIIAARSLGLDCGPMSGFDNAQVDKTFFTNNKWKSNFICNLGYGDATKLFPRSPRLEFTEACEII